MESFATNNLDQPPQNVDPQATPTPIAEFVVRADYPQCTLHQLVDIGGYAGTVTEIVRDSLKVRSPEQSTKSFNYHTLKKLYGPRIEVAPMPERSYSVAAPEKSASTYQEPGEPERVEPKRNVIADPNFAAPVKALAEFLNRPDYPQCTFGEHLEINGYTGVVVEIVNGSLKVRSREEVTRSYNAAVLKKLYGAK
jgi:hypothetical protein